LLAGVGQAIDHRASRRRNIRIVAAVAAAAFLLFGIWTSNLSRQADVQSDWTNASVLLPPSWQTPGPCATSMSCLDTQGLLARIDLDDPAKSAEAVLSIN
jgi:hypothetical protein